MNNISFSNPWLLLIGVVGLLAIIIPFFIAVKKGNFNLHNLGPFIIHVVLVILLTLAMAKMTLNLVVTETNVYVLADVSYSSNKNLDKIDEYIIDLGKNVPKNTKIGIVCFAKDQEVLTNPGERIRSVKESSVDNTATDISGALKYTSTLFKSGVIKRIVLISDGHETNQSSVTSLIKDLENEEIYIDAIYLDNNIKSDEYEIQIDGVSFTSDTYLDKEEYVTASIYSNQKAKSKISLYKNETLYKSLVEALEGGNNNIKIALDTTEAGVANYKLVVEPFNEDIDGSYDTSTYNNEYIFSQNVVKSVSVLFISDSTDDKNSFDELYGDSYNITYFVGDKNIPYTVEELCKYDEIVLANVNVANLNNAASFVANLDIAVSEFGKSLVTIGNTYIQNGETNEVLNDLGSMLPVKFDNLDNTKRIFTIILDISKSMNQISHFLMAKESANAIIDMLDENDDLVIITFYGDVEVAYGIKNCTKENKEEAKVIVNNLEAKQATSLGAGLKRTYDFVKDLAYAKKECILISDGRSYGPDATNITEYSKKLGEANINVDVVFTADHDNDAKNQTLVLVASNAKGNYYQVWDQESASNIVRTEIADNVTENHKKGDFSVNVTKPKNELVSDVNSKPENIKDFYTGINKSTSTKVIEIIADNNSYPLYSTWNYGNGCVSSFVTNLSACGSWLTSNSTGNKVLANLLNANTPEEHVYSPFIFNVNTTGSITHVEVTAPTISSSSKLTLKIVYPDGTQKEESLAFDSQNYIADIISDQIGQYELILNFELGSMSYSGNYKFAISYYPEYDAFEIYDASSLYSMVNNNGKVSEDGHLVISNEGMPIVTYHFEFATLFYILSAVLFVIDVALRKLRWADIKGLFVKVKKEGK